MTTSAIVFLAITPAEAIRAQPKNPSYGSRAQAPAQKRSRFTHDNLILCAAKFQYDWQDLTGE
jgi:hypothetical protein